MTGILAENRSHILAGLRDALAGSSSLSRIVRHHVGIEDEAGSPADGAGKLLRPALVLFAARELGAELDSALPAAVALELVHNFSLVHDDIQDRDQTRRGRPTLWAVHGEGEAINAGDHLHAVAFREVARCGTAAVSCLAAATIEMIEGQSLDLFYEGRFVSIAEYVTMIDKKTGALLRCAMELGGVTAGVGDQTLSGLREIGGSLGRAFQIRDDALGIWGDGDVVGKPQGSDVRRRKKSYPVVWAYRRAGAADRRRLEAIYSAAPVAEADAAWVVEWMDQLGAAAASDAAARENLAAARQALARLPFSARGSEALDELIEYLAGRPK